MKQQKNPINNPTLDAKYNRWIENFRKEHVPKQYNQILLMDELNNPDIDHFFSISNRTDGKTINYIHGLLNFAIKFEVGLMFVARKFTSRPSFQDVIDEVAEISEILDVSNFNFIRSHDYVRVDYNKKTIAVIVALNDAQDLKEYSNYIKNFPIMIFEEFLVLEESYVTDEWIKLKTIYESIDRIEEYPVIRKPKIFYLGNAVNFESPVFHAMNMFNILENHPINTMKIYKQKFNGFTFHFALEMHRNENQNKIRNTRAFGGDVQDAMTTARFETNDFRIATDNDRYLIKRNPRTIYVKLKDAYLKIWFNRDTFDNILSIESNIQEDYHYNMQLKDNTEKSIYLNERYFDDDHIKKIDRGYYLFENNYSKNYITSDFYELNRLRINKLIREFLKYETEQTEIESKEKQFEENYIEQTKKGLMNKLFG